jgi:hypothetical protein
MLIETWELPFNERRRSAVRPPQRVRGGWSGIEVFPLYLSWSEMLELEERTCLIGKSPR